MGRIICFLCTALYLINPSKCISQSKTSLPLHLENANGIVELHVQQLNLDSFHLVSKEEMPFRVNERMERIYYSFDNPVNYTFLGNPVEKIQISLDKDSVIVALYFIFPLTDKLLPAALQRFGKEGIGWTATTPFSSPDDPVPYNHFWEVGEHFLSFSDLDVIRNGRIVQEGKVKVSFKKSLRDYYKE